MKSNLLSVVVGGLTLAGSVVAGPLLPRQVTQVSLPQSDPAPAARASALATKAAGWGYGPPLLGGPFFPNGTLGGARIQQDLGAFQADILFINGQLAADIALVQQAIGANGGLKSLDDYSNVLYNNQWHGAVPSGENPGILSNYTEDLEFSMERISLNPYAIRRVKQSESIPFDLPVLTALKIATLPVTALKNLGRLFVVDHSYQAKYPKNARYGAACTALFFIHPWTGDFLPLAIQNNDNNLIYTPLDSANDWLLAKIIFNVNDLFFAQMYHLAASHDVGEPVHMAAERTLSGDHPIMALLDRLMNQAYAVRPVGARVLFTPGGAFDQIFYVNASGAIQYVSEIYPKAGDFEKNYLDVDLKARGLINAAWGPDFKTFPFYDDAKIVRNTILTFMTTFVNSYYTSDAVMAGDTELQAFFREATNSAQVINFPCPRHTSPECNSRSALIKLLTHFAWITGAAHHILNTGNLVTALGTLPFHPAALYAPIPTTKGVADLLPFMPPVPKALFQINLNGAFNRPQYESQNKTLAFAYSDPAFISRFNADVGAAAATYKDTMLNLSAAIRARTFDANGLSQGMPFVYKSLDPGTIPYFFAV